ncbi:ATP-dependent DNA helicase DinG [Ornithinibacillus halophilus]|uniref:3'-5' exonuclease DinG n=1 Tax=Ornithinibacillus halophilus TaxID=930117 RepID=A0A1M5CN17_9BACI|nr:ATP-dependent DNA helicase DinG [Ornithinibacillus halophilus]SHF56154.1 ATP-dependent DNA helicase DinG [Ornithinibacillus halophilus]
MDKFVVIDLETTGNSIENNDKIIEVGIVVIEKDEIVDEYTTLLHPNKPIPPFISNLTGITDKDVINAPTFDTIAEDIVEIFKDSYLVAHNVPFDLGFLNYELTNLGIDRLLNPVIDTVELSRILFPNAPGYKLSQLSEYFDLTHDYPHRALSDAYVTAKLLLVLKNKLKSLPQETVRQLIKLEKTLKSDISLILHDLNNNLPKVKEEITSYGGIAFKNTSDDLLETREISNSFGTFLDGIYEVEGRMQTLFERYEKRPGQREMSETIYDCFVSNNHGLIEAETGTGKSLAYLIPAVYDALKSKSKIVISTFTTQLQQQLLDEELPLAQKIIGHPFNTALIKGKQHYISLEKFARELEVNNKDNYDITLTKAILLVWITETNTGDIEEIHLPSSGYMYFKKVSTETETNINPLSPWFSYSFYQKAKKRAKKADLIITNHALLCSDLFNDFEILPKYNKVIIDEAHHLEETASRHYGLKLDYVTFQHSLNRISSTDGTILDVVNNDKWNLLLTDTKHEIDDMFRTLFQYVLSQSKKNQSYSDTGRIQYRFDLEKEEAQRWNVIKDMALRVNNQLKKMVNELQLAINLDQDQKIKNEIEASVLALQEYIFSIERFFIKGNSSEYVNWMEVDAYGAKNAVYLYSEPTDVSELLSKKFFEVKDSIILTSATLTMKKSFSFIQNRLGVPDDRLISKQIHSPFQYEQQVQLMVPNDFPDISFSTMDDFIYATCEAIISLSEITNGRMLVLFTSYDMLRKAHNILKEALESTEYVLIAQGISSGSRARLKKNFQTFDQAILLGTNSFWEGVDIPGEDLSCLMIVRLPFQPPNHPVYEAKAKHVQEENKNPFFELSLPNAVIRFKQGFGRLIRSKTDRGIVFVCDSRLIKARYSTYFTKSIPNIPVHYKSTAELLEIAENWF